ncbi:MAG: hypothetical protein HUU15_20305, partial [Candidatus Brocadiae bacterium]|nr:hypothetical protein [Candidatus Brocadiia bacterium]
LDRGIALAPHAAGLRFNRARLQWDHAPSDDALADFRLAVELYPNLAVHRFWLARALRARGADGWRGHYDAALALSAAADMPRRMLDAEEEAEARAAVGE